MKTNIPNELEKERMAERILVWFLQIGNAVHQNKCRIYIFAVRKWFVVS
ncbi:hypothetical protein SAMN05421740_1185 [Parapedobacter koreensis]|uniref:Uncharacterized protein n=1 Tax=Parapedobacter koreensis TaxID=332977 RepID=A0A1H7UL18_9SPHI|nr:hypothetical protein SAMN05421740_1185 [Parapedobacter koreensis]